jgi:hypothetical protein
MVFHYRPALDWRVDSDKQHLHTFFESVPREDDYGTVVLTCEISDRRIVLVHKPESQLRYFGTCVALDAHTRGVVRFKREYVARSRAFGNYESRKCAGRLSACITRSLHNGLNCEANFCD